MLLGHAASYAVGHAIVPYIGHVIVAMHQAQEHAVGCRPCGPQAVGCTSHATGRRVKAVGHDLLVAIHVALAEALPRLFLLERLVAELYFLLPLYSNAG